MLHKYADKSNCGLFWFDCILCLHFVANDEKKEGFINNKSQVHVWREHTHRIL